MSARMLIGACAVSFAAALSACAPTVGPGMGYGPPPPSGAFAADDFGWSQRLGQGSIEGRIAYVREGVVYDCTGSVALTPETPYTRARFAALYGNTQAAALPEAVVRARTVADPNADYRSFVRSATCSDNRFGFSGLPDGAWYLITPVAAHGGDRIVLMRRVETRGGRMVAVTL